ncbi:MAG TPA: cytochrome c [Steroidobacteraceae bacterium]|jgi:mono/diheme cytochrome c family protein|nr:cytochrome c [Steroidobacteraceae bacterium]
MKTGCKLIRPVWVLVALGLALGAFTPRPASAQSAGVSMFSGGVLKTTSGVEVYRQICQGCHMPDGKGAVGAGHYPALAGDGSLASREFMAMTLLEGRRNMPAFGGNGDVGLFFSVPTLDDEQIAAVINYVRSNFGNHFKGTITAAEVKALRRPVHATLVPAR